MIVKLFLLASRKVDLIVPGTNKPILWPLVEKNQLASDKVDFIAPCGEKNLFFDLVEKNRVRNGKNICFIRVIHRIAEKSVTF